MKKHGIHIYTEEHDVVYAGNGYLALHSATGGTKRLTLPRTYRLSPRFGTDLTEQITDRIEFNLDKNATVLFAVQREKQ